MYDYTDRMDEISGFGGGYEASCRAMVKAGLEFWNQQGEDFDPHFRGWKGVFGLFMEDNDDAKALSAAVVAAVPDCSSAMHQAAMSHIFAVRQLGWDEYVRQMEERAS
jgi:hypothetical protein